MPNELTRVLAPAAVAGDMLVIAVELWTQTVVVHLARVQGTETDRLMAEYEAAIGAWTAGDEMPEPPDARIGHDLAVADDVGTAYEPRTGQSGGSGTEWRALWVFAPGVPDTATRLTISGGGDSLELAL
jgi:hypothetical protein